MNKELVYQMMQLVHGSKIQNGAKWVKCSCIFAPWIHTKGTDSNPSFAISISDHGKSRFNCYTCGRHGDLTDMVMELRHYAANTGYEFDYSAMLQLIATEEDDFGDFSIPDYDEIHAKKKTQVFTEFPQVWLDSFLKMPIHPYLTKRGVTQETALKFDLRFDFAEKRICVPIRTADGVLAGLQGRSTNPTELLRYKLYNYKGNYNPSVWGGEHTCNIMLPLVITEGFFDLFQIYQAYPNVVCSLTSKITPDKAKRLQDALEIITLYDFGKGGDSGRKLVDQYWPNAHITHITPTEEVGDAGNMETQQIYDLLVDYI